MQHSELINFSISFYQSGETRLDVTHLHVINISDEGVSEKLVILNKTGL